MRLRKWTIMGRKTILPKMEIRLWITNEKLSTSAGKETVNFIPQCALLRTEIVFYIAFTGERISVFWSVLRTENCSVTNNILFIQAFFVTISCIKISIGLCNDPTLCFELANFLLIFCKVIFQKERMLARLMHEKFTRKENFTVLKQFCCKQQQEGT